VQDGRIHPASIEEFVKRAQDEIDQHTAQAGRAVTRLNINGMHAELIKLLGKLKYRFSYTQNALITPWRWASSPRCWPASSARSQHRQTAGLLHDIGKAVDGEFEGSHALIGAEVIKRHGETPMVVNAVAAHHEEVKPRRSMPALSFWPTRFPRCARGAPESMTNYLQRLERLEKLAMSIEGVQQAFAIQAAAKSASW